jgi:uncharacterized membrane protein YhaH (DUF805 family)
MTVLKFLFSFEGRIGRAWYWLIQILQTAIASVLMAAAGIFSPSLGDNEISDVVLYAALGAVLAIYFAMWLANHAKRWHDLGRSGWWTLIVLIAMVGPVILLIMCGLVRGDVGANAYGRALEV